MSRSPKAQYLRRVNQAYQFLNRGQSPAQAVARLTVQWGVSPRQAARYVQSAQRQSGLQAIPQAKEAFTVKLPHNLVKCVRQAAAAQQSSISDWVAAALDSQLSRVRHHG